MSKKGLSAALGVLIFAALVLGGAAAAAAASMAKWKVIIPQVSAVEVNRVLNLAGPAGRLQSTPDGIGYVYDDSESAIEVYATIGMMSGGTYWTIFRTWVHFPEQIEIKDVLQTRDEYDPAVPLASPCFPNGGTSLFDFINGVHPYDARYVVDIVFMGPYVNSRAEADWENKPLGWSICGRVAISILPEELTDCHLSLPDHHQICIQSHEATLTKVSPTSYRVVMTADFSLQDRLWGVPPWTTYASKDYILHRYTDCVTRISRKTAYETMEYHFPELGEAPFNLEMLYTKR